MKFTIAFSALIAAATAQTFESYAEPNFQGGVQIFDSVGWFYLTPNAYSYKFDSEGGQWAFKTPAGGAANCDGDVEVAELASPLGTVEVAPAADIC